MNTDIYVNHFLVMHFN